MLGAGREITPGRLAFAELLLPGPRRVQGTLTFIYTKARVSLQLQELVAFVLCAFEMLCDLFASSSLARKCQAQLFEPVPGFRLSSRESASLRELRRNGAQSPSESLDVPEPTNLL